MMTFFVLVSLFPDLAVMFGLIGLVIGAAIGSTLVWLCKR